MLELQARPVFVLAHLISVWPPLYTIIQLKQEIKATKAKIGVKEAKIEGIEAKIDGIEAAMKFNQAEIQSGKVHHRFTMYRRFILLILSLGERPKAKRAKR